MIIDIVKAGPAYLAAPMPVTVKIPVPTIEPRPKKTKSITLKCLCISVLLEYFFFLRKIVMLSPSIVNDFLLSVS